MNISKSTQEKVGITKSTRHQKIIGQFGEHIICNWLSRSGFEVAIVDHTGIDIIAFDPLEKTRLGISVKSRTRNIGTEKTHVTIFRKDGKQKLTDACSAFSCEPWIAVYVETADSADIYMATLDHYLENYGNPKASQISWKMSDSNKQRYRNDKNVFHLHVDFTPIQWWDRTNQNSP